MIDGKKNEIVSKNCLQLSLKRVHCWGHRLKRTTFQHDTKTAVEI